MDRAGGTDDVSESNLCGRNGERELWLVGYFSVSGFKNYFHLKGLNFILCSLKRFIINRTTS